MKDPKNETVVFFGFENLKAFPEIVWRIELVFSCYSSLSILSINSVRPKERGFGEGLCSTWNESDVMYLEFG